MKDQFAMTFPGQGSQKLGMLGNYTQVELVRNTLDAASLVLDYDLEELINKGPSEVLNQTENTQPALLASGVALWRLWLDSGGEQPRLMAGHSLGEYTALVCSEVISLEEGVSLVRKRGQYMQEAVINGKGKMAAVIGLSDDDVMDICTQIAGESDSIVEAVNFNAPGQVVIAGQKNAVSQASELAKHRGAKVILLPVSVPAHCALMKPAAEKLKNVLVGISFSTPKISIVQNVTAEVCSDIQILKENLVKQLYNPVLWVDSIRTMFNIGIKLFIECGPGKVLTGLNRRIVDQATGATLDTPSVMKELLSL